MNKIVHKHVPARRLPKDLTDGLPPDALVTVTLEPEEDTNHRRSRAELVALLKAARADIKGEGVSVDEAVNRVRELRDEWED